MRHIIRRAAVGGLFSAVAAASAQAQWEHKVSVDRMTGQSSAMFTAVSSNDLALSAPYDRPNNRGTLVLALGAGLPGGAAAFLSIEHGQFVCTPKCGVMLKADDGPAKLLQGERPPDHSHSVVQFTGDAAWAFHLAGSKANKLLVQATYYQSGAKILEFDTPGGTLGAKKTGQPASAASQ